MMKYREWVQSGNYHRYALNDTYSIVLLIPNHIDSKPCVVSLINPMGDENDTHNRYIIESVQFYVNPTSSVDCIRQYSFNELMQELDFHAGRAKYLYDELKEAYDEIFICD